MSQELGTISSPADAAADHQQQQQLQQQITLLTQQVKQRDEKITVMMNKTKDFVQKLKEEHALQLASSEERCRKIAAEYQLLKEEHKVGWLVGRLTSSSSSQSSSSSSVMMIVNLWLCVNRK